MQSHSIAGAKNELNLSDQQEPHSDSYQPRTSMTSESTNKVQAIKNRNRKLTSIDRAVNKKYTIKNLKG